MKRFDAYLEWLMERIGLRDEEMDRIRVDDQIEDLEITQMLKMRMKSVAEVFEEVGVIVDTQFFRVLSDQVFRVSEESSFEPNSN